MSESKVPNSIPDRTAEYNPISIPEATVAYQNSKPEDRELALDWAAEFLAAQEEGRQIELADLCRERPDLITLVLAFLNGGLLCEDAAEKAVNAPPLFVDGETIPETIDRYVMKGKIGQGGMGVVYRAIDTAFGREVAVKVLQSRYGPDSSAASRFSDEARITGQLQHPAIPAVHDLGKLADGRPFLTMKLIKGETLETLLKTNSKTVSVLGRFLSVFEAICQGVAYAHSRGVIHRDLKPPNIMVGAFGEVQVMDWGLAKIIESQSAENHVHETNTDGTTIQSIRETEDSLTQAGSVLGTPAFMPPEQAIGAIDRVDARSDVFGLGGILCVILTGKPPFVGTSAETTRQLAVMGKLSDAFGRLDASGVETDLISLCKRCLAPEQSNRPQNAGEVAKAIAQLRIDADERARQADLEKVRSIIVEREKHRRQKLFQRGLIVLIAVIFIGIAGTLTGLLRAVDAKRKEAETTLNAKIEKEELDNKTLVETLRNTARLEMQRGRWKLAYDALEQISQKQDLSEEIQLERARVLFALDRIEEVRAILDAISNKSAAALLLEADVFLGTDNEKSKMLINEALTRSEQLTKADHAYARGLLSTNLATARAQFQSAVGKDPYHFRANVMLAWVELFALHKTSIPEHLRTARTFFPNDPNFIVIESLFHAANGKAILAIENMRKVEQQLNPQDFLLLKTLISFVSEFNDFENSLSIPDDKFFPKINNMMKLISTRLSDFPTEEVKKFDARLVLPPFLTEVFRPIFKDNKLDNYFSVVFMIQSLFSGKLSNDIATNNLDAVFMICQASALFDGRFKQAYPLLVKSIDSPSLFKHRRFALTLLALCEYRLSQKQFSGDGDPKWKIEAVKHWKELMAEGGSPRYMTLAAIVGAKECGDPHLALAMARDNLERNPNDHWAMLAVIAGYQWTGNSDACLKLIAELKAKSVTKEIETMLEKNRDLAIKDLADTYLKHKNLVDMKISGK